MGRQKKMPYAISKAIIDNAHRRRLRVAAHIFYLADAKQLVEGGLDALAHSVRDQLVDQELIDSMKKHGAWQMPLPRWPAKNPPLSTPSRAPFLDRSVLHPIRFRRCPRDVERSRISEENRGGPRFPQIPRPARDGSEKPEASGRCRNPVWLWAPIAASLPAFPGFFEHRELELMVEAGLTPRRSSQRPRKAAAEFLRANDLGTLEAGKWADLIVLNVNPMANVRNMRQIEAVYIAGNKVAP